MKFSINRLAAAVAVTYLASSSSAIASTSSTHPPVADPLACTDEEINAIMTQYKSSLGELNKYQPPSFDKYREVRMVHGAQDPDKKDESLCQILMDANFKIPSIDLQQLKSAWASLKALMAGTSGGIDWSKTMKMAYDKGMEKFQEWWKESQCKLAQDFSRAALESIEEAEDDLKENINDSILGNDIIQDSGITDLDNKNNPIWKQVAKKQTDKQLGEYSGYANWYETDDWKGDKTQESMDDIIDKLLGDVKEDALDKNLDNKGDERLDSILDKFEPNYDK